MQFCSDIERQYNHLHIFHTHIALYLNMLKNLICLMFHGLINYHELACCMENSSQLIFIYFCFQMEYISGIILFLKEIIYGLSTVRDK